MLIIPVLFHMMSLLEEYEH